jgi:hypothetical protein
MEELCRDLFIRAVLSDHGHQLSRTTLKMNALPTIYYQLDEMGQLKDACWNRNRNETHTPDVLTQSLAPHCLSLRYAALVAWNCLQAF